MEQRERAWPLMAFTVLGPASVGCLLGTLLLRGPDSPDSVELAGLTVALVSGAAAVGLSLAHLSKPARAYRALRRFPGSPLSREIGTFGIYLTLVFVAWLVGLVASCPAWLLALGVVAGVVAVVASAQVYLLPARPSWRHWSTVGTFLGCGLSLGLSTALLATSLTPDGLSGAREVDVAEALVLLGIVVTAASLWRRVAYLRRASPDTQAAWQAVSTSYAGLWWARLIVGIALAAAAAVLSFTAEAWLWLAWPCLLAGELIDRRLFFASVVPLSFRAELRDVPSTRGS